MSMTTLQPNAPLSNRPGVVSAQPSSARYWIGGTLIVVGVIGAIAWLGLGWLALMHHVDGFSRMSVPGTVTLHVNADTKRVFYSEHARGTADITATDIRVTGPSGEVMAVGAYPYDLRYDVPGNSTRVGRAVASFRSTTAGLYTVTVTGASPGSTIAVGDDVVWNAVPHVIGAGLLFLVCVGSGAALLAVTATRRARARRG